MARRSGKIRERIKLFFNLAQAPYRLTAIPLESMSKLTSNHRLVCGGVGCNALQDGVCNVFQLQLHHEKAALRVESSEAIFNLTKLAFTCLHSLGDVDQLRIDARPLFIRPRGCLGPSLQDRSDGKIVRNIAVLAQGNKFVCML